MGTRWGRRCVALACAVAVGAIGCAHVETETRTERGPVLRIFDREVAPVPGGIRARVDVRWPRLELSVSAFDVCRKEKVEEYAEERITERSAPMAGPAIAMGSTYTLLGAGLFGGRYLLSDAPNTRTIDAAGRYGPSDRQIATGWSVALLALGIPALATGLIEASQVGETTEVRKGEQVISALEAPCHERPASGTLELRGGQGLPPPQPLRDGKLSLSADQLQQGALEKLLLDGRELELAGEDAARLDAFLACTKVLLPEPGGGGLATPDVAGLRVRLEQVQRCRKMPGVLAEEAAAVLEKEVAARMQAGKPEEEPTAGPRVQSFEEAVAAYTPRLRLSPESPDLAKLGRPEALAGQAVLVEGILVQHVEANILAVDVGRLRVWVYVEGEPPWARDLSVGSRVEAVAVVVGRQVLGAREAPLLKAVWMRPGL